MTTGGRDFREVLGRGDSTGGVRLRVLTVDFGGSLGSDVPLLTGEQLDHSSTEPMEVRERSERMDGPEEASYAEDACEEADVVVNKSSC
jgi:hypothetical protein